MKIMTLSSLDDLFSQTFLAHRPPRAPRALWEESNESVVRLDAELPRGRLKLKTARSFFFSLFGFVVGCLLPTPSDDASFFYQELDRDREVT